MKKERAELRKFRITTWPSISVDVPKVPLWDVRLDGNVMAYVELRRPFSESALPEELYLRELREIDPASPDDLLAFVQQFGAVGLPNQLPPSDAKMFDYAGYDVPVSAVATHVRTLQNATDVWIAHLQGRLADLVPRTGLLPGVVRQVRKPTAWKPPAALDFLESAMNAALLPFHARILVEEGLNVGDATINAYSAMFLQLFNDIAESSEFRTCAYELCDQVFVRQRGTSKYGQHRSVGVLYCSRGHARAQAMREHRRRDRKGKR